MHNTKNYKFSNAHTLHTHSLDIGKKVTLYHVMKAARNLYCYRCTLSLTSALDEGGCLIITSPLFSDK
jgi:hypothetical protein